MIVRVATSNTRWPFDMAFANRFTRDDRDHINKLVNGDHLVRSYVHGTCEGRPHQAYSTFEAFIDIQEGACLLSVTPDFDLSSIGRQSNLTTDGRRNFFLAIIPTAL